MSIRFFSTVLLVSITMSTTVFASSGYSPFGQNPLRHRLSVLPIDAQLPILAQQAIKAQRAEDERLREELKEQQQRDLENLRRLFDEMGVEHDWSRVR